MVQGLYLVNEQAFFDDPWPSGQRKRWPPNHKDHEKNQPNSVKFFEDGGTIFQQWKATYLDQHESDLDNLIILHFI